MDASMDLLTQPKSLDDMRSILVKLKTLDMNKMNKSVYVTFLSGFRVIVNIYESKHPDSNNEANEDIILDWIRFYQKTQSLVASSEALSVLFLKSVPIAVTYIVGCLLHISNATPKFYTEFTTAAILLLCQRDRSLLKKLEKCGKGLITHLWTVVDRVGNFNTQMKVLKLIFLILKIFNERLVLFEVEEIPNLSIMEKEKIVQLLKVKSLDVYQKLSRDILNLHNRLQRSSSLVHSFSCESFNIADQFSFSKEKHFDRFWIDINSKPYTLTFRGLLLSKSETVEVSLEIKNFFCYKEKLKVEYIPPADISGTTIDIEEIKNINEAYAVLPDNEMKRFIKIFKAKVLKLEKNENKKIKNVENSTSNSDMSVSKNKTETFKKPSLELYQSIISKLKPKPILSQMEEENLIKDSSNPNIQKCLSLTEQQTNAEKHLFKKTPVRTHIILPAKDETTNISNRRFFKHPRQPKKLEIPWKIPPIRKSIVTTSINRKNQTQGVQHITTSNASKKRANENNSSIEVQEKRQHFENALNGPTTSVELMKLQNQMQDEEKKYENINIAKRTPKIKLTDCFESVNTERNTVQDSINKTTPNAFNKKFEAITSSQPELVTTSLNNKKQEIENSTNAKNEETDIKRSRTKRTFSDADFDSSSDESDFDYTQKKKVIKKRRCYQRPNTRLKTITDKESR